jgi:hypothetical protein
MDATDAERTAAVANVLDRLVTAQVAPDKSAQTQRNVETIELKPDENILSRLTEDKQKDTAPPQQPVTEQQTAEQTRQALKKGLLDELVGGQSTGQTADSMEKQESDRDSGRQSGDDKNG